MVITCLGCDQEFQETEDTPYPGLCQSCMAFLDELTVAPPTEQELEDMERYFNPGELDGQIQIGTDQIK